MKTIKITVSPTGQTTVETRGFTGGECREASRFVEQALGTPIGRDAHRRVLPGSGNRAAPGPADLSFALARRPRRGARPPSQGRRHDASPTPAGTYACPGLGPDVPPPGHRRPGRRGRDPGGASASGPARTFRASRRPTGFDPGTSLLTRAGFKPISAITLDDEVATLERDAGVMRFQRPTGLPAGHYEGPMYRMSTKHIDILATPAQRLWVARPGGAYRGVRADEFFGSKNEWQFRKDCTWAGVERPWMELCGSSAEQPNPVPRPGGDGRLAGVPRLLPGRGACVPDYRWRARVPGLPVPVLALLDEDRRGPGSARPRETTSRARTASRSTAAGCTASWHRSATPTRNTSPEYVQDLSSRQLRILLDAYLAGDGHLGACVEYGSSSERLAGDIRLVCLKLGWCVTLKRLERSDTWRERPHWRPDQSQAPAAVVEERPVAGLRLAPRGDGPLRRRGPRPHRPRRPGLLPEGGQDLLGVRRRPVVPARPPAPP